ncbi:TetR/AcrR family transcriptional regulator [Sphingomonas abietis]|uniref:TetR/AcrR family transcriptional regulator n=1 Tax=Sphingomonas abietis TaxID=3012344 RepID=A0ABY7NJI7_9SPHN|nr:TetR/AcrR family transcriptional regulator [Sphingomonas abietis]WBO21700.1 TetR/AcrR family transcriptional regulator [Sphingomonas abietis]
MTTQSAAHSTTSAPKQSRFERKRERILDAAMVLINERGVKGMTFAELAQTVELNTTSITYYFRLKEHLAAAVFEHTLERLEAMAIEAGAEPDPHARVSKYLELHFDMRARVLRGEERGIATLSDIRALEDSVREPLMKHYQAIFRLIRGFFGDVGDSDRKALLTARAHMLIEVTFWLPVWINDYSISDFARVRARLFELLAHGIAPAGSGFAPMPIPAPEDDIADPPETGSGAFLRAATRLINDLGYRGASVDRIVAELNVTKGSFYHHLDAKDDLVLECFRHSYHRVSRAQRVADEAGGTHWQRLSTAIAMLLDVQFGGTWPLLRTTALLALPANVRADVVERSNRMAMRFAGTLVDGISEGSIRPIDPMITSQIVMATLNAAYDLRHWAERLPRDQAVSTYASTLATGLFD